MTSSALDGPLWIISGTRPEVIKLAPVLRQFKKRFGKDAVSWISTGQHMALERETLAVFGISPDHSLTNRDTDETLVGFTTRTISQLTGLQARERPGLVFVQGDTATTFAGAFAAFHAGIPVAHIEAGLRTGDIHDPFPEESYRRMTDAMTDLHFAPTYGPSETLRNEGYRERSIVVTGNTSVDTLRMLDDMGPVAPLPLPDGVTDDTRIVFVTIHRRESWGRGVEQLCEAVKELAGSYDDIQVILPVHVNPIVHDTVTSMLSGAPRVTLTPPLDFRTCHSVIRRAHLILTDSGGITEEAPSYGVPTLVLRNFTERPESIEAGFARLVGTDRQKVLAAARAVLDDKAVHARMSATFNPYGDGNASARIALATERFLSGADRLLDCTEEFRCPPL